MRILTLVGQMGAGKSSVARALARVWSPGFTAVDLDVVIAEEAGDDIPTIFATEGEAGFRRRERRALAAVLRRDGVVLATGGGAPCRPGAMARILAVGPCVWLDAPPEVLAARALRSGGRPLLDGLDLAAATRLLAEQRAVRAPHYRLSSHTVAADQPLDDVVAAITGRLSPETPWP